jgi:hypothetical protein
VRRPRPTAARPPNRGEWIDPTVCLHEDIAGLTAAIRRHHSDIEQILKGFQRLPWG